MQMLWGRVKICENCMYTFLCVIINYKVTSKKFRQMTLKHTTHNGRLPFTNELIIVPDAEVPDGAEKINLKKLY